MPQPSFRAIAILKAKGGQERALLDFTLSTLPEIRKVDGLRSVEVSQCPTRASWCSTTTGRPSKTLSDTSPDQSMRK